MVVATGGGDDDSDLDRNDGNDEGSVDGDGS